MGRVWEAVAAQLHAAGKLTSPNSVESTRDPRATVLYRPTERFEPRLRSLATLMAFRPVLRWRVGSGGFFADARSWRCEFRNLLSEASTTSGRCSELCRPPDVRRVVLKLSPASGCAVCCIRGRCVGGGHALACTVRAGGQDNRYLHFHDAPRASQASTTIHRPLAMVARHCRAGPSVRHCRKSQVTRARAGSQPAPASPSHLCLHFQDANVL